MEELVAAPALRHRERRHRRKASDAAAAARAAYGDVFGGPPRFAAPFAGVPGDYAEVFGGVAASCSIPYLDLPPADAAACDEGGMGAYGEIFGRFNFGDFAAPYEDVFACADGMVEEIASPSGSSRSSIRKGSGLLDVEPSIYYQHHPNVGYERHFDDEEFSPISFSPDGGHQFNMSYNKATRGRPDDLVEIATCMVEPSISYVVDSSNLSGDSAVNHVPLGDDGLLVNGEKGKMSPSFPASSDGHSANSGSAANQKQHTPTCLPVSENINVNEDENNHKRSSTHSASSEEVPSPDYPFLRVSNINLQTPPIKVHPPLMQQSKLLTKKESKAIGDSEVNPNAAAAAIKEAMEFAEARLKAAKEMMERKGDTFKLRKKPGHHRGRKSTEIKERPTPEKVHVFEGTQRLIVNEETNCENLPLLDKKREGSTVKLPFPDLDKRKVLKPTKPQHMVQSGCKLEQLGKWASDAEFYELISHDRECKTDTAACQDDNDLRTNGEVSAEDLTRHGKLCVDNDTTEPRVRHANLREDDAPSTAAEIPSCEEKMPYQEPVDLHFKEIGGLRYFPEGHDDDGRFEISSIKVIPPEKSDSSLETCISGSYANLQKKCSDASTEETPVMGTSNKDNGNEEGSEIPCGDETLCTSVCRLLQEHHEVPNTNKLEVSEVKLENLDESAGSCETECFQPMSSTVDGEVETSEKDTPFSFVDETCLQNESEIGTEIRSEALNNVEMEKNGTEITGQHEDFQDVDVDWDAGSLENVGSITLESSNANENKEMLNVFVQDSKSMENSVTPCDTFDEDSDQLQVSLLGPQNHENRMDGVEDLIFDGNEKVAQEPLVGNNDKTLVGEILKHDSQDGETSMEIGISKGPNDIYAEVDVRNDMDDTVMHFETEVTAGGNSDYTMNTSTCSEDLQDSFPEARATGQHLSQNAESVSSQISDKSIPVLENLEDCRKAEKESRTEKYAAFEGQFTGGKMEERNAKERTSNVKDQQSIHLDGDTMPKFALDTAPNFVQKSRKETTEVQRIEGRDTLKRIEREIEKEVFLRVDEEERRECKMAKENEQIKERQRREMEEEKERERERAKDRLAVQRATREAHERAFAEARAKAERIALERITSSRQRVTAEAREREEKACVEAVAEKASREARIKAERAAVERATAEARERAIEKAKAAADAKERMERFRSSFKDSFKATDQDNQQDTQFQKTASSDYGRSTDTCNQVVEAESALRHKARTERHQRTAERAAKALAEKNMRDMLAQREQTEKHRLAEFLDPEVKRWSNGKEGNLRALLSTLQYILGSDSGWQSVPLTDLITAAAVKKAYRRATLCVHPDKLQQRGATIRQKYICEKVFDLLKDAWNKFNYEER